MKRLLKFLQLLIDNRVYRAFAIMAICGILAITAHSIGIAGFWIIVGVVAFIMIVTNALESPRPEEEVTLKKLHILD